MSARVARLAALAFLLALGAGQAGPVSAADPFYAGLMETGISAHARGDYLVAARELRVASFGLLEEPEKLAECLTYLALAQAEIAEVPEFTRTIDRLLEVERRFHAYSALALDAALRQALEGHLLAWVPFEVLDRSVVFRDLGRRKREAEIREMAPAERRAELELRLAAEPAYAPWLELLAELDFAEGDFPAVLSSAETLLRQAPEMARVRCLRGRSGAALGLCEQALLDLEACDASLDIALQEQRLRCHLALQDFDAASGVLAQVSAGDRQRPPFRQLAKEVDRGRAAAAKALAVAQKVEAEQAAALAAAEAAPAAAATAETVPGTEPADTEPAGTEPPIAVGDPPAVPPEAESPAADTPPMVEAGEPPVISVGAVPAGEPQGPEPTPAPESTEAAAPPPLAPPQVGLPEAAPPEAPPPSLPLTAPPSLPLTAPVSLSPSTAPPPVALPVTADRIRAELERLKALAQTRSRADLETGFAAARALADSQPQLVEPQRLAGVFAYRLSRWEDVVTYIRRAGEPETADRQFYLSVALYEAGDRVAAKEVLQQCLPMLEPTDFVRGYAEKILNGG